MITTLELILYAWIVPYDKFYILLFVFFCVGRMVACLRRRRNPPMVFVRRRKTIAVQLVQWTCFFVLVTASLYSFWAYYRWIYLAWEYEPFPYPDRLVRAIATLLHTPPPPGYIDLGGCHPEGTGFLQRVLMTEAALLGMFSVWLRPARGSARLVRSGSSRGSSSLAE